MIRRHAGQEALEVAVGQIGLAPGAVSLDVDQLEAARRRRATGPRPARWSAGEFLEGFAVPDASAFEDWLASERELWRRRGTEVLVRCADGLAARGPLGRSLASPPRGP